MEREKGAQDMTWGEFKKLVEEAGVTDEWEIEDVNFDSKGRWTVFEIVFDLEQNK